MARTESRFPDDQSAPVRAVVLASSSATRAALLAATGIVAEIVPPAVDEAGVKASLVQQGVKPAEIARGLAELKALRVSRNRPGALVIGADQVLVCNDVLFDKPADMDHARAALQALRGKTHELASAVCIALDSNVIWHESGRARLTMRRFSDGFLDDYLTRVGTAALASVGAYQIEGLGAQLFTRIDGDVFTILGLPMLPLLDVLRRHRVLKS